MKLPIGYDDFGNVIEKGLDYVDKTLFIKEVLDDSAQAMVITRPRRFGKTFNLSILHYFLAAKVYGQPTQGMFDGLKIYQCGKEYIPITPQNAKLGAEVTRDLNCFASEKPKEYSLYCEAFPTQNNLKVDVKSDAKVRILRCNGYMQHQGKYPVISVTFKDIKASNYPSAYENLSKLMSDLYLEHRELLTSPKLDQLEKQNFRRIADRSSDETELKSALKDLMHYLCLHYEVKPWLLIDEYDTPIQAAYLYQYYDKMIEFMRGMLGSALKNNPYLNKAVITGILRVAKESLFSGVNNLEVYSLLRDEYSEHFGFTEVEVNNILMQSDLSEKAEEIKQWYNGYQFGRTTIYNPWSIANCVKRKGEVEPYWVDTSDNQLIKDLFKRTPLQFKQEFEGLVSGNTVEKLIDEQLAFHYLEGSPDALWHLLLMAGYLKPVAVRKTERGVFAALAIPNREVRSLYRQIIEQWLSNGHGISWYDEFIDSLLEGKIEAFKTHLEKVLLQIVSCHDVSKEPEAFYHGLLLGFIVSLRQTHEIKSNRESGLGRFDILIIPNDLTKYGIVIELKVKGAKETLSACAGQALKQIEQKKYTEEFKQRGIDNVIQIGIGFKGKICAIAHKLSC